MRANDLVPDEKGRQKNRYKVDKNEKGNWAIFKWTDWGYGNYWEQQDQYGQYAKKEQAWKAFRDNGLGEQSSFLRKADELINKISDITW